MQMLKNVHRKPRTVVAREAPEGYDGMGRCLAAAMANAEQPPTTPMTRRRRSSSERRAAAPVKRMKKHTSARAATSAACGEDQHTKVRERVHAYSRTPSNSRQRW
jgi:hypothetical protein